MLKPNNAIVPIDQITAVKTTILHTITTLNERKKIYNRIDVAKIAAAIKIYISLITRFPITTRK